MLCHIISIKLVSYVVEENSDFILKLLSRKKINVTKRQIIFVKMICLNMQKAVILELHKVETIIKKICIIENIMKDCQETIEMLYSIFVNLVVL